MAAAMGPPCPVGTTSALSLQEAAGLAPPDIKAYKLGKKRWSYNQVEVVLAQAGGGRTLAVRQASHLSSDKVRDAGVAFGLQLATGHSVQAHLYLVYDAPLAAGADPASQHFQWTLVDRCACAKGCTGPVLRVIQRFGKLGKRAAASPQNAAAHAAGAAASAYSGDGSPLGGANSCMKDQRFMYLSFDEAGTHVRAKAFRLLVGLYDRTGTQLLSSAVSAPIRVLANNDVPTGAASISVEVPMPPAWEGWAGVAGSPLSAGSPVSPLAGLAHHFPTPPLGRASPRTAGSPSGSDSLAGVHHLAGRSPVGGGLSPDRHGGFMHAGGAGLGDPHGLDALLHYGGGAAFPALPGVMPGMAGLPQMQMQMQMQMHHHLAAPGRSADDSPSKRARVARGDGMPVKQELFGSAGNLFYPGLGPAAGLDALGPLSAGSPAGGGGADPLITFMQLMMQQQQQQQAPGPSVELPPRALPLPHAPAAAAAPAAAPKGAAGGPIAIRAVADGFSTLEGLERQAAPAAPPRAAAAGGERAADGSPASSSPCPSICDIFGGGLEADFLLGDDLFASSGGAAGGGGAAAVGAH